MVSMYNHHLLPQNHYWEWYRDQSNAKVQVQVQLKLQCENLHLILCKGVFTRDEIQPVTGI